MVVLGQDEGDGRHAFATELYVVRSRHLYAVHCTHKQQGVAGP